MIKNLIKTIIKLIKNNKKSKSIAK